MEKTKSDKQTENSIEQINEYSRCFGCVCGKIGKIYTPGSLPSQCSEMMNKLLLMKYVVLYLKSRKATFDRGKSMSKRLEVGLLQ